jgi:hypothetical protein
MNKGGAEIVKSVAWTRRMKPNTPARYYGGLRRRRVPVGFRLWHWRGGKRWTIHYYARNWITEERSRANKPGRGGDFE